jgi:hypothetical protein
MQENQRAEGDHQQLEQEVGVKPVGRKADGFDVPFHHAALRRICLEAFGRRDLGRDQTAPHEEPRKSHVRTAPDIMKKIAPNMSISFWCGI